MLIRVPLASNQSFCAPCLSLIFWVVCLKCLRVVLSKGLWLALKGVDMIGISAQYEKVVEKILSLLNSPEYKLKSVLLERNFFVLCGASGSGKTISIELVNERLPEGEQIAESLDILYCRDAGEIDHILAGGESSYEGCKYVAYSIVNKEVGRILADSKICEVIFI